MGKNFVKSTNKGKSMIIFIGIYIVFALIGFEVSKGKKKILLGERFGIGIDSEKLYLIIAFIVMFIICALREETVGTDTQTYVKTFLMPELLNSTVGGGRKKFEIGYILLVRMLRTINDNPHFFIFATSLIVFGGMYIFVRDNCKASYSIAVIVYMSFLYYTNFSALRQSLALAIAINSVGYLRKRQLIKAVCLIFIGASFHFTALIMLTFIPLALTKWNRSKTMWSIVISIGGVALFDQLLSFVLKFFPVYERYLSNGMMENTGDSKIGLFTLLVAIICSASVLKLYIGKDNFENESEKEYFVFSLIGCIFCLVINILGNQNGIFSRMCRFFIPYIMINLGYIYKYCFTKSRILYYIMVASVIGVYFYIRMKINLYQIIPYSFFWR